MQNHARKMPASEPNILRPPLHYLGSKSTIAPWVIKHLPSHTTYVEPFGGGASVLLRKPESAVEVYNDLDSQVVSFWRVLRTQPDKLVAMIQATPWARKEYDQAFEDAPDDLEAARRFFLRCWMSYMGCTSRKTGWKANARSRNGYIPLWGREERLLAVAQRLRSVQIENDEALKVIHRFDGPETLYYCDPPYVPSTRSSGNQYGCEMAESDHLELLKALLNLQGMVVLSGYPSEMYCDLLGSKGWRNLTKPSRTRNPKVVRTECLWISPSAACSGMGFETRLTDAG